MTDTYSTSLRFIYQQDGTNATTWGDETNTNWTLVEQAITGAAAITLTGTTFVLTSSNGATDQARSAVYNFQGSLGGPCTVTIPPVVKLGWANNATIGGFGILLTTGVGGGANAALNAGWSLFFCDGTNVMVPTMNAVFNNIDVNNDASIFNLTTVNSPTFIKAPVMFGGANNPITYQLSAGNVADLPVLSLTFIGSLSFAKDGRNPGEGATAGTGCLVQLQSKAGVATWCAVWSGVQVTA